MNSIQFAPLTILYIFKVMPYKAISEKAKSDNENIPDVV